MADPDLTIAVNFDSLPLLPGALKHARAFLSTAAGQRNRNHLAPLVDTTAIDQAREEICYDPQTSGGLLVAIAADRAEALLADLVKDDPRSAIIGQALRSEGPKAVVM
jgi:selenide,water dikinase